LAALDAQDPRARAAAVRVAGQWHTRVDDLEPKLATLARDEHPRVRLEAVCALSRFSNAAAADAALAALDQPQDRFLDYALWQTARDLAPYWLPKVQAGEFDFGGNAEHLRFALEAVASPEAVKSLVTLLRENRLKPEGEASAVGVIARAGGPAELGLTLGQTVLAEELADGRRARMLDLLVEASRQRRTRPEGDLERIVPLLDSQEGALQLAAVRAVGSWRIEAARAALLKLIEGDSTSDPLRGAALESLADLGGDPSRDSLQAIIEGTAPLMLRLAAVAAFARLDLKQAVTQAVKLLAETDPQQANPSDLFRTLLQRKQGPETLMAALLGAKLPPDVARIGIRMARLQGQKHDLLVAALQQAGGLTSQPRVLSPEELASMLEMVAHQGDPARGEAIFRRRDMGCFKCHAIGGAGGVVGPDLSTIGSSAQPDYLIESMLNPAAKIKENYHAVVVSTDDGRVFSGIKVRQTDQELVLRDAEDRQVSIALDSIDEQAPAGSLMPVGLIEPLTTPELVDLVRFLSELGKVGPYAVGTAPLARRWETMLATDEAQFRLRRTSFASAAREEEPFVWEPAYSTTSGELPLAELPVLRPRPDSPRVGFARCELQVTTPGRVALELTSPPGLSLWVDGEPVTVQRRIELELEPGRHALTFAVDLDQSQTVQGQSQQGQSEQGQSQQEPGVQAESVQGLATLRCQLAPVEGSRAQVQWVLGK
jgi:putative heme-binding domain-containing protein